MPRTLRRAVRPLSAFALAGALSTLAGCAGGRVAQYRGDPTPETATLGDSQAQMHNRSAEMLDANLSLLLEDLARMGLWDRPSRLTKKPIPR
ncbi:MAG: hypothetical protein D6824_01815 [Planctomycetota bacterium]|nr:MAG: hypothetical protein D6824_01815 [Planctomycetota bacterium]